MERANREPGFFGGSPTARLGHLPLLPRTGIALAAITGLALFAMVASVMIAQTAKDDAAAINQAGSLRMQSYRMLSLVQQASEGERLDQAMAYFERTLNGATIHDALPGYDHPLVQHYEAIRRQWTTRLRPLLAQGGDKLAGTVEDFVADLDTLVAGMQQQAETRIRLLRLIQGVAIFLTLAVICALYANLERRVENKTHNLKRSNDALKLLLDTARSMATDSTDGPALQGTVERLAAILGGNPVTLCLAQPEAHRAYSSHSSSPAGPPGFCSAPECGNCLQLSRGCQRSMIEPGVVVIPLADRDCGYGVLLIQYPDGAVPERWKLRLAEAVAGQIASALARARELRQKRHLALMEERAVIARELHDSLAQSLAYLKIQVSRMQTLRRRGAGNDALEPVMAELREGLSEAYRHLRELLVAFRLKINEPGLEPALEATVAEFSKRDDIAIRLDVRGIGAPLDANAEIHLLHIAREALANIVHHARASEAEVVLTETATGELLLTVDDNGIGLPQRFEKAHHFGTRIMQERTESLGGTLSIERRPAGGTRVQVRFPRRAASPRSAAA